MPQGNLASVLRSPYARVLTAVLLVQAAAFYYASRGEAKIELAQPLEQFPMTSGDWRVAGVGVVEPEVQEVLRADDTLTRWYQSPMGGVNLFVAFFKTQRTGQSPHSPKNCLPGSGWVPSTTGMIDVPIPAAHETIKINRYVVSKGENRSVVLYWYQTEKRVIADEFAAKYYLVADSIRYHHSDTSLVRVVVPVAGHNDDAATAVGVSFVQAVYPQLRTYLPH
ncbi:MAG TPA: EpsI family protein [Solibacterales bacterium]|nr:EpsI family protein [Bryobacterales bacterium]